MSETLFEFYHDKKVFITGHTGFKGSWLSKVLINAGAKVYGYALCPSSSQSLFRLCDLESNMESHIGDIRNLEELNQYFTGIRPDIVFHLAAQPIVRESYQNPVYTYDVNVMGTVNVLECIRTCESVRSVVNVTTDKVYQNREWCWGYRENEELNGYDPYSNSKSCSELVTACYNNSFYREHQVAVSTARAGNVIGGGDFARDRILPDCLRAIMNNESILVRNPHSVRPYQHVLEPIMAYLMIAKEQYNNYNLCDSYNVGPSGSDCWSTGQVVEEFCQQWFKAGNNRVEWKTISNDGPHEANFLKLDCSKIKNALHWTPKWTLDTAIQKVVEWDMAFLNGQDLNDCMNTQLREYYVCK